MPDVPLRAEWTDYALVDAGELRRLERFGAALVDRPAATAVDWRLDPPAWLGERALRFDPGSGWRTGDFAISIPAERRPEAGGWLSHVDVDPWPVLIHGLTMEVRLTSSGGVGLYPEHAANIEWLVGQVGARASGDATANVLNLFAHTGLMTLAAARAGATVSHVDASRGAVAWARRNAELSGLAGAPVRWLVDDALGFVDREARRGRRYDGIVLDPPSFGRAGRRQWRLQDELPALLAACREVAAPGAFVLLTAHTTGLAGDELAGALRDAFPGARPSLQPLSLAAESGATLDLGWAVRHGA